MGAQSYKISRGSNTSRSIQVRYSGLPVVHIISNIGDDVKDWMNLLATGETLNLESGIFCLIWWLFALTLNAPTSSVLILLYNQVRPGRQCSCVWQEKVKRLPQYVWKHRVTVSMFRHTQTHPRQQVRLWEQTGWKSFQALKNNLCFLSVQVDKGVVPLSGTNGETTTQGRKAMPPHTIQTSAVVLRLTYFFMTFILTRNTVVV